MLFFFLIFNITFALPWSDQLGNLTLHNNVLEGNKRFRGNTDLDLHLPTHWVNTPKLANEFRVFFIGDSSTYGVLLREQEITAELIRTKQLQVCNDKQVVVYNLASTGQSTLMDLLMIDSTLKYEPDMIVWFFTMNTFADEEATLPREFLPINLPYEQLTLNRQFVPDFILHNPDKTANVIETYDIKLEIPAELFGDRTILGHTFLMRRHYVADWYNLQLEGIRFSAVGDADIRKKVIRNKTNLAEFFTLPENAEYKGLTPPVTNEILIYTDILKTTLEKVDAPSFLLVNEPILISAQKNSDIHYNDAYPRWAYDQYREYMSSLASENQWNYLDLWNLVPASEFTNSSFHRSPEGERLVAEKVTPAILDLACKK
jgi:hypothetical protein